MPEKIYTFLLNLDMKLLNKISQINGFDEKWSIVEKRDNQTLMHLKQVATVSSVGASTRIEGSKLTDPEVEALIENLKIATLEERDQQEVAGYFEVLDAINESFADIHITEGNIKNLHNLLMKYCDKDAWHKGDYKQVSNAVEATRADGTRQIMFRTADPGLETERAMQHLFNWYASDNETHPLIKTALFVYDFLSIHPFQDGNGRMSRLISTLLLLKEGHSWIQYVSFEHEIESRKKEYYQVLMNTQKQRPNETVDEWIAFFMDCLSNIQTKLLLKMAGQNADASSGIREKKILAVVSNNPGLKSGEIAKRLNLALPTVKRDLATLVAKRRIMRLGAGAGTNYILEEQIPVLSDDFFRLTNAVRKREFVLRSIGDFIRIKRVILEPQFDWIRPDEWSTPLMTHSLGFQLSFTTADNSFTGKSYTFSAYVRNMMIQPVFDFNPPIQIPFPQANLLNPRSYPVKISVELTASVEMIKFDVLFVHDIVGS